MRLNFRNIIVIEKSRLLIALFFIFQLILCSSWKSAYAVPDDFKIKRISPEGGFTFEALSSICEDKYGFILVRLEQWPLSFQFSSNSKVHQLP